MAKTNKSGVWGQDVQSGRGQKQVTKVKVVRDDWDDDDDEEEEEARASGSKIDGTVLVSISTERREQEEEEESSKIWEEANKRAPMPELIVAAASTSQSFPPPPPAALQPTLRILKRPSPNTSTPASLGSLSSSSSSLGQRSTLAEREAQYQEARSRIFGDKDGVVVVRSPAAEVEPDWPERCGINK